MLLKFATYFYKTANVFETAIEQIGAHEHQYLDNTLDNPNSIGKYYRERCTTILVAKNVLFSAFNQQRLYSLQNCIAECDYADMLKMLAVDAIERRSIIAKCITHYREDNPKAYNVELSVEAVYSAVQTLLPDVLNT